MGKKPLTGDSKYSSQEKSKDVVHKKTTNSVVNREAAQKTNDARSKSKGSVRRKKPALSKTFYSRGYNSESNGRKTLSKQVKISKHRRIDSGGKHANQKILEHASKLKKNKNEIVDNQSPPSFDVFKGKQLSYNNFSSHFKQPESTKIAKPAIISNPLYKRMNNPNKSMSSKNEFVKKTKKFNFDL